MITRTEAERVAQSIHIIRPDWPTSSLVTLITRDLADWPLLDIYVGLAHVAIERDTQGNWLSRTPARVKEDGPWRNITGEVSETARARQRYRKELEASYATIAARGERNRECLICEPNGYFDGQPCHHPHMPDKSPEAIEATRDYIRRQLAELRGWKSSA